MWFVVEALALDHQPNFSLLGDDLDTKILILNKIGSEAFVRMICRFDPNKQKTPITIAV